MGGTTARTERGLSGLYHHTTILCFESHCEPVPFCEQRFTPQFLLMRLRHATTQLDDASEAVASSFVRSSPSEALTSTPVNGNGKDVDEFINQFREMRKTYHKRVMWGDRWSAGEVAWRDD